MLTPDLLGVGATAMPVDRAYSLEAEVDGLLALLASVDEPAFVFGHSFGGLVAIEAALRAPERFRALALFEPVVVVLADRDGSDAAKAEVEKIGELMKTLVDDGYARWMELFIDWWNGPWFFRSLPDAQKAQQLATAHEAWRQAGVVMQSTVTTEKLSGLDVRTLFLTGTTSPTSARESARIAADAMPRASLDIIEGAGHMAPLTHGPTVNAKVLAHFESGGQAPPHVQP